MSPWAGLETKKYLKSPTITRTNRTHYTLLTMLYFREILSWILIMIVGPVIVPLYHQWSVLVCNATNNNDLHFSIVKRFLDLCMPQLQVHVTTWDLHVVALQSVHSTGTLLVLPINHLVVGASLHKILLYYGNFIVLWQFYCVLRKNSKNKPWCDICIQANKFAFRIFMQCYGGFCW